MDEIAVLANMRTGGRVFISIYLVVFAVIGANLVFGKLGLLSYNEMNEYKKKIEENINELQKVNTELVQESEKLISQQEEICLQARQLGWLRSDENVIIVRGLDSVSKGYAIGKLFTYSQHPELLNCKNFTIFSIIMGLIFFLLSGFYAQTKNKT